MSRQHMYISLGSFSTSRGSGYQAPKAHLRDGETKAQER